MTVVLGAGPAGLTVGIELLRKGFEVKIYDTKNRVGHPQHCTGVVSKRFIELIGLPRRYILNQYRGVNLWIYEESFEFTTSESKAFTIDRIGYELWLYKILLDYGGEVYLSRKMPPKDIHIDATGAVTYIKDKVGSVLPGLQRYGVARNEIGNDRVSVFINKEFIPDFFGWAVPIKDNICRIGLASKLGNLRRALDYIKDKINSYFPSDKRNSLYGFVIVGGHRKKFYDPLTNKVYVGDSAGQTKPSTGGGLLYMTLASKMLSQRMGDGYEYIDLYESMLGREIFIQKFIREITLKLNKDDIISLFEVLSKKEKVNLVLLYGDMDFHSSTLLKVIMDRDILKIISKSLGRLVM